MLEIKIDNKIVKIEESKPVESFETNKISVVRLEYNTDLGIYLYNSRLTHPNHHFIVNVPQEYISYACRQSFGFMGFNYIFYSDEKVDKSYYEKMFYHSKILLHHPRLYLYSFVYFKKKQVNAVHVNGEEVDRSDKECEGCPLREGGCSKKHIHLVAINKENIDALCSFLKENYEEIREGASINIRLLLKNSELHPAIIDPFGILDLKRENQFVVFIPSFFCKTNCTHCYLGEKIKDDTVIDVSSAVKYLGKFGYDTNVVFHGGEPTNIPASFYKKIINLFPTYTFSMQTNLLSENIDEWIELFKMMGGNVSTSYVNDGYRKGDREIWWRNLRKLKEHGITPFIIVTYKAGMDANELYNELKGYPFRVNPLYYSDRVKNKKYDEEMMQGYGEFLCELADIWLRDIDNFNACHPVGEILAGFINNSQTKCPFTTTCSDRTFALGPNGDLYLGCGYDFKDKVRLGNVSSDTVEGIKMKSDTYKTARKRAFEIFKQCGDCEYYFVCQGGCPMHSYYKKDDLLSKTVYCEEYKKFFKFIKDYISRYEISYLHQKVKNTLSQLGVVD